MSANETFIVQDQIYHALYEKIMSVCDVESYILATLDWLPKFNYLMAHACKTFLQKDDKKNLLKKIQSMFAVLEKNKSKFNVAQYHFILYAKNELRESNPH
jgi:hypothetical protein